jgi:hypothetical protein
MRPIRSRSRTLRLILRNRERVPKDLDKPCALRRKLIGCGKCLPARD